MAKLSTFILKNMTLFTYYHKGKTVWIPKNIAITATPEDLAFLSYPNNIRISHSKQESSSRRFLAGLTSQEIDSVAVLSAILDHKIERMFDNNGTRVPSDQFCDEIWQYLRDYNRLDAPLVQVLRRLDTWEPTLTKN